MLLVLLLLSCGNPSPSDTLKSTAIASEQDVEVQKLKEQISKANKKLDCIPQIIEKNISQDCQELILLKR